MIAKRFVSLFAGVGGFDLALERQGWECVGYSEINKRAIETYQKHFNSPSLGDIKTIDEKSLPDFDLLCGGFPCQSFSNAGHRRGFDDTRGTLFFDIARIVKEKRPKYLLLENVKGLLSNDGGRTFKTIMSTIVELGYDTETMVVDGYYFDGSSRPRIVIFAVHREQKTHVRQGNEQAFPIYSAISKRIRLTNHSSRDEEIGRSASGIIRATTKLPPWLDGWSSIYGEEKTNG